MAEWLILLLLVPAIVVPVVLLVGFAGCAFDKGRGVTTVIAADGKDRSTITVTYDGDTAAQKFEFRRTNLADNSIVDPLPVPSLPPSFDDPDLDRHTPYSYQVRGVFPDGPDSWSFPPQLGRTLAFETTFDVTKESSVDQGNLQGITIVQRVEASGLTPVSSMPVTQVRIILYASSAGAASIDRIFISAPAPAGKPYDSEATDPMGRLRPVLLPSTPLVVTPNIPVYLTVDFVVRPPSGTDPGQALLIAIDFSPAPVSAVKVWPPVPAGSSVAWFRQGPPEAAVATRSAGYTSSPAVYLIGKIEIG